MRVLTKHVPAYGSSKPDERRDQMRLCRDIEAAVEEFKRARKLMPLTDGTSVLLSEAMGASLSSRPRPRVATPDESP